MEGADYGVTPVVVLPEPQVKSEENRSGPFSYESLKRLVLDDHLDTVRPLSDFERFAQLVGWQMVGDEPGQFPGKLGIIFQQSQGLLEIPAAGCAEFQVPLS